MPFKRSSYEMLVGEIECSDQSNGLVCNYCGQSVAHQHKPSCPGNYVCTICGHLKTDHLDLKPCTPKKNMCLCPQCNHYAGSSSKSQHSTSSFSQSPSSSHQSTYDSFNPTPSSYQPYSSTQPQTPVGFTNVIVMVLLFVSWLYTIVGIITFLLSILGGWYVGLVMVIPTLVGIIGVRQGIRIRKGFFPKIPMFKVIFLLFIEVAILCGISVLLMGL